MSNIGFYFLAAAVLLFTCAFYFTRYSPRAVRRLLFYVLSPMLVILTLSAVVSILNKYGVGYNLGIVWPSPKKVPAHASKAGP